jgi:outer membrane protein assembly factor BamB
MAEISAGAAPSIPIIVVEGGPVEGLADGEVAGSEDAWEMIEAIAAARGEEGTDFWMGEIREITVGGATGAWVDIHWEQEGDDVAGRAVAFRLGSWGLVVQSAGLKAVWEPFEPTFEALVDSLVFMGPFEEVIWKIGGESGSESGEFSAIGGMDIGPGGNLFVADNLSRIQIISAEGSVLYSFGEEELWNASDVKVAADGTAYVADWGNNAVAAFTSEGEMWQWGSAGTGEGEFGDFSPGYLAVCPDGRVYVADSNEDASGDDYERVQVFDPQGGYLDQWNISEIDDFFSISGMDCGPDGNLYLVGFIGGYVMVLDPAGNLLAALGEDAIAWSAPSSLAVGPAGNIYVGSWNEGVLVLDPLGGLLGRWGTSTDEDGPRSEGQLQYADGLAVDADGNIFVGDWAGGYSYVTKSVFP